MAKTAETFLSEERQRFQKLREDLKEQRQGIDNQLAEIDRELEALTAYEQIKAGKGYQPSLPMEAKPRKPRTESGPRAPRGKRAALKNQITALIKQHPEGLLSKQIATHFPDQAKALPNLLTSMKKEGTIHQEARGAPYFIPSGEEAA